MTSTSPVSLCTDRIAHFRRKADHNKRESLALFVMTIVATLTAPLLITLGTDGLTNKVIPAVLSTIAAGATAWLHQRRPQQLWALYRGAERELEYHLQRYELHTGEYGESSDPDRLLAEHVTEIVFRTHSGWTALLPQPTGSGGR